MAAHVFETSASSLPAGWLNRGMYGCSICSETASDSDCLSFCFCATSYYYLYVYNICQFMPLMDCGCI